MNDAEPVAAAAWAARFGFRVVVVSAARLLYLSLTVCLLQRNTATINIKQPTGRMGLFHHGQAVAFAG